MSSISSRIKKRRIELGLTQSDLAGLAGYADRSMISKIEKGDIDLSIGRLRSLADALNTTTEYLYGYVDDEIEPVLNSKLSDTFRSRVSASLTNSDRSNVETAFSTCFLYENILANGHPISLDTAYDIADKLGVSLDYLTGLTGNEEDQGGRYFLSHNQYQQQPDASGADKAAQIAPPAPIRELLDALSDIGAFNSDGSINEEGMSLVIGFIKQNASLLRRLMPSASADQLTNYTLGRICVKHALKSESSEDDSQE